MDEKLVKEIKAAVESIFSQKEEAKMREQTEAALQEAATTIDDLNKRLEQMTEKLVQMSEEVWGSIHIYGQITIRGQFRTNFRQGITN